METKCCVCNKTLFIDGKRQTPSCYSLIVIEEIATDHEYTDRSGARVFICKNCFSHKFRNKIMNSLFSKQEAVDKIRAVREVD